MLLFITSYHHRLKSSVPISSTFGTDYWNILPGWLSKSSSFTAYSPGHCCSIRWHCWPIRIDQQQPRIPQPHLCLLYMICWVDRPHRVTKREREGGGERNTDRERERERWEAGPHVRARTNRFLRTKRSTEERTWGSRSPESSRPRLARAIPELVLPPPSK